MYESPITMYMGQMQEEIEKQETEQLLLTVNQTIGFDVDKEELIKALWYDREQYNKGFSDCKSYMLGKIKQAKEEIQELLDQEVIIEHHSEEPTEEYLTETGEGLEIALDILDKLIESEG